MTLYTEINKSNYIQFFKDYMSEKEEYLSYLKNTLMTKGLDEEQFDFSPESLISIWRLVQPLVKWEIPLPNYKGNLNALPIWALLGGRLGFFSEEENGGYSFETINLLGGVTYYLGEVLVKNNNACWDKPTILVESDYRAFFPIIRLRPKNEWYHAIAIPFVASLTVAGNVWRFKDKLHDKNLYDHYRWYVDEYVNATPPPTPKSQFKNVYPNLDERLQDLGIYELEELVSIEILSKENRVSIDGTECNKCFYTSPVLEEVIGEKSFKYLEDILMSIEGVTFAAQEDREIFYLKSAVAKKKLQVAVLEKLEMLVALL